MRSVSFQRILKNIYILDFIKNNKKRLRTIIANVVLSSLVLIPIPYATKLLFDEAITHGDSYLLFMLLSAICALYLIRYFSEKAKKIESVKLQKHFQCYLKNIYLALLLQLPSKEYDRSSAGRILSGFNSIQIVSGIFSERIYSNIFSLIHVAVIVLILGIINKWICLSAIIIFPLYYLAVRNNIIILREYGKNMIQEETVLLRKINEVILSFFNIKASAGEKCETRMFAQVVDRVREAGIQEDVGFINAEQKINIMDYFAQFIIIALSIILIISRKITFGDYIAISLYTNSIIGCVQQIAGFGILIQPIGNHYMNMSFLLDDIAEDADNQNGKSHRIIGNIEFRNVSFSYIDKRILENINLEVRTGERVLLVGPNGSGKSTIIKLMLGLYIPSGGEILIDGNDLRYLNKRIYRAQIAYVAQSNVLFKGTIRNNIMYPNDNIADSDLREAARKVGLLFEKDKHFLDYTIEELAKNISGGEMQKIILARALINTPKIIIFDEIYKNLDSKSKNGLNDVINTEFSKQTMIMVSHEELNSLKFDRRIQISNRMAAEI